MKKLLCSLLALLILTGSFTALAAGKIEVTQENLVVTDYYGAYGYAFARVENTGNKPISVNAGVLELYNADGDSIASSDYLDAYCENLNPGEYTYAQINAYPSDAEAADIDDYMLTITGKSDSYYTFVRYPVVAEFEKDVIDEYDNPTSYMYATVTNDTEEPVYDMQIVFALLDAEGNILYIASNSIYNTAITPGSSVTFRAEIPYDFADAFEKNGYTPATVDAIAYVKNYNN